MLNPDRQYAKSVEARLDPLDFSLVPTIACIAFQVEIAAWTPYAFPYHEDGAMRTVFLTYSIS
jgi:hypothetical protein